MSRLALLTTLALAACANDGTTLGEPGTTSVETKDIPLYANSKIDILFVVDNSPAMAAQRDHLAAVARPLAQSLFASTIAPDLHLGVITGDPADGGRLHDGFLADEPRWNWERYRNYDGTLPDNFAAMFDVGASGSAQQSLVANALAALAPTTNGAFIRPDAYLAVFFITASDDASTLDVTQAVASFKALKVDPAKIIIGTTTADDGTRSAKLVTLAHGFESRNAIVPLSTADLRGLTEIVALLAKVTLGAPCIEGHLAQPRQIAAWIEDRTTGRSATYPECSATNAAHCWSLVADAAACPAGDQLRLNIPVGDFTFEAHAMFHILTDLAE